MQDYTTIKFAGFWKRLIAVCVDGIILLIIVSIIALTFHIPLKSGINFLVLLVYNVLLETSQWQGTIGKLVLGIRVADVNGNRLTLKNSFIRNLAKIVSAISFYTGYTRILAPYWRQTIHDSLAEAIVVTKPI